MCIVDEIAMKTNVSLKELMSMPQKERDTLTHKY